MARRGHHTLDQIKDMVINAAEELIEQGGLCNLRVRNIATKIGYTVGSIYMVFDSMNDLIVHMKGRTLDKISEQMENVDAENAEQCLEEFASIYVRFASENLSRWSMVFEHRLPHDYETPPWYQNKVDNLYKKFEDQFKLLTPELTVSERKQTALAFLGGVHGICVLMLTKQLGGFNDLDMEESIMLLTRRFIHDCYMPKLTKQRAKNVDWQAVSPQGKTQIENSDYQTAIG